MKTIEQMNAELNQLRYNLEFYRSGLKSQCEGLIGASYGKNDFDDFDYNYEQIAAYMFEIKRSSKLIHNLLGTNNQ